MNPQPTIQTAPPLANIESSEISVIIQGNYMAGHSSGDLVATSEVIASWRRILPECQIILSIWEPPLSPPPSIDLLVVSQDPGPTVSGRGSKEINVGRQIRSTHNGLKVADRKYAIKTRTDILPSGIGFISLFLQPRERRPEFCILEHPIVTCSFCTLDPKKTGVHLHVSDIFHFGITADLLKLWDIVLPIVDQGQKYARMNKAGRALTVDQATLRPEQYITLALIRKSNPALDISYPQDSSLLVESQGESYVFNNFTIRHCSEIGIELPSRMTDPKFANRVYSACQIHHNEATLGNADAVDPMPPAEANFFSSTFENFRAMPHNLKAPFWLAGIAMVLQHPNIFWNTKKLKSWINYRQEGRRLT